MKRPILLTAFSASILLGTQAFAQVTLSGSVQSFGVNGDGGSFDTSSAGATASFSTSASTDTVLAITLFAIEGNSNVLTPSVTLDPGGLNISLSQLEFAQSSDNGDLQAFVFAANVGILSSGSLDIEVDWDTSANDFSSVRGAMVAYQLSGATVSGAVTDGSGNKDTALTLPALTAGSFAVDMLVDGSNSISTSPYGSPTANPGFIAPGNRGLASGYYENVPNGDLITGWDGNAAQVSVAAAFQPVPEPSTFALALGMLALGGVVIRRRISH